MMQVDDEHPEWLQAADEEEACQSNDDVSTSAENVPEDLRDYTI